VMLDPLDPREETPTSEPRTPAQAEPMSTDREVPLPTRELPDAVHAFLDGEQVPESALSAVERELDLWKRISAETGRRRRMVTPAYMPKQILAKLSDD